MPSALITMPGDDTVEAKSRALAELARSRCKPASAIATRTSRRTRRRHPRADRIFIKLPEFTDEVADDLATAKAVGIDGYAGCRLRSDAVSDRDRSSPCPRRACA